MACALFGVAASPGEAHAWENWYCGVLINSGSWCGDGSNHSYDYNRGKYTGTGYVYVCARLLYADSTTVREGPGCGYNIGENFTYNNPYLYEAEVTHQSGSARHTIHGYART